MTVDVMSGLRNRILFCFSNYNRNFLLFAILEKGLKHFFFFFFLIFNFIPNKGRNTEFFIDTK